MALKVFLVAIVLFLAEVIFITTKDIQTSNFGQADFYFTDVAFENINGYLITKDKVEAHIVASKVLKYQDFAIIKDIKASFMNEDKTHKVNAKKATLRDDIINLSGDVHYENNQSVTIDSDKLIYNTKTKLIKSQTPFIMNSLQGSLKGDQFTYDQKNGKINSKSIHYISKKEIK